MESVYDRALNEINPEGKFQIKFDIIYNMIFAIVWALAYMNLYLVLVILPHNCELPIRPNNTSVDMWKMKYIPTVDNTSGVNKFNSCAIYVNPNESNETKVCDRYIYDKSWYHSTIPSENNWVCDKEILVANVLAYSRIGELIGSVFFGWFADFYGRRLTYIISLFLIIFGRLVSIVAFKNFTLFAIGCVIAWLPSWSPIQTATVMSLEISSPARRTTTTSLRFASYSFGTCLMPFVYWWLRDWRLFLIVTTAGILPFLALSWKIIESPRWLWVKGKPKECLKQLHRIAKKNNTKLENSTETEILTTPPVADTGPSLGALSLFSGRRIALNTVLQLLLWVVVTLSYTVLLITSGEKSDGNPFIEFASQSAAELPGNLLGAWLADRIGRRYTCATSFGTTAVIWIFMAYKEHSANNWLHIWWVSSSLSVINRLSTTVSYYVINLFNMELYPTCLRQSGMSIGNLFASGTAVFAVYLLYEGRRIDPRIPSLILSIAAVSGAIFSLMLPETLNAQLPETLEDAKTFGTSRRVKPAPKNQHELENLKPTDDEESVPINN